jgi:hypothetical protein
VTSPRPWILAEQPLPAVRAAAYQVAILPWGATEAHNLHLPYGTDNVESEAIAMVVRLNEIPFTVAHGCGGVRFGGAAEGRLVAPP